jgi:hypothetical protein
MTDIASSLIAEKRRRLQGGVISAGVLIWNEVTADGQQAFYRWHNAEHMPERMAIPGFIRGRRYASDSVPPQWFTLYEATSLDVLVSPAYLERLNNPSPATRETLQFFRNTARSVCLLQRAAGTAVGGYALVLRFDGRDESTSSQAAHAQAVTALEAVEAVTGVVSTSLYGAELSASQIATAESKTRALDVPGLTLLVEVSHKKAAEQCLSLIKGFDWLRCGLALRQEHSLYSLEVCFV